MNEIAQMIFGSLGNVLDRVIPDKNKRAEAQEALQNVLISNEFALALEQIKVNAIEAASDSFFKSGWRPAVGWTCASAFALHFLIFPIVDKIITLFGGAPQSIPFDMQTLMWALGGLLGLGTMRTVEKLKK